MLKLACDQGQPLLGKFLFGDVDQKTGETGPAVGEGRVLGSQEQRFRHARRRHDGHFRLHLGSVARRPWSATAPRLEGAADFKRFSLVLDPYLDLSAGWQEALVETWIATLEAPPATRPMTVAEGSLLCYQIFLGGLDTTAIAAPSGDSPSATGAHAIMRPGAPEKATPSSRA